MCRREGRSRPAGSSFVQRNVAGSGAQSPPKLGGVASRTAKREPAKRKRDSAQPQEIGRSLTRSASPIGRSLKGSERRRGGYEWEPPRLASLGTPPNLGVVLPARRGPITVRNFSIVQIRPC